MPNFVLYLLTLIVLLCIVYVYCMSSLKEQVASCDWNLVPHHKKKLLAGGGGILENSSQWDAAKQIMRHV